LERSPQEKGRKLLLHLISISPLRERRELQKRVSKPGRGKRRYPRKNGNACSQKKKKTDVKVEIHEKKKKKKKKKTPADRERRKKKPFCLPRKKTQ